MLRTDVGLLILTQRIRRISQRGPPLPPVSRQRFATNDWPTNDGNQRDDPSDDPSDDGSTVVGIGCRGRRSWTRSHLRRKRKRRDFKFDRLYELTTGEVETVVFSFDKRQRRWRRFGHRFIQKPPKSTRL